jgi:hypothetical protein
MSYVKQNFTDGSVLTAEQLNHMEDGIVNASSSPMLIKNAVFFGDSITHGVYSYYNTEGGRENGFDKTDDGHPRIPAYFGMLANCNVTNHGARGSGWVADNRGLGDAVEKTQITNFADYDFAAYCLGINDYIQGKPLGTINLERAAVNGTGGAPITVTLSQGYYSGATVNNELKTRVKSTFIEGPFRVECNEGYAIRAVYCYKSTTNLNESTCPLSNATETSFEFNGEGDYKYSIITFCSADGTQNISPTDNIIKSLVTAPEYVIGPVLKEGTIVGNMALCFQQIAEQNPHCKIVCYSPYNAWGQVSVGGDYTSNTLYGDESTRYCLGRKNSAGYTLQDLIDTIDKVCTWYGIRHVPLSQSNICNLLTIKDIMIDGLHPSREARPYLAAEIFGQKGFDR